MFSLVVPSRVPGFHSSFGSRRESTPLVVHPKVILQNHGTVIVCNSNRYFKGFKGSKSILLKRQRSMLSLFRKLIKDLPQLEDEVRIPIFIGLTFVLNLLERSALVCIPFRKLES